MEILPLPKSEYNGAGLKKFLNFQPTYARLTVNSTDTAAPRFAYGFPETCRKHTISKAQLCGKCSF